MRLSQLVSLIKQWYSIGNIDLTDEGPQLLGQQVVIAPRSLFTGLIEQYQDDPELEYMIYRTMKCSVYNFCESLDSDQDMEPAELLRTLMKLTKLNGYGHIEINDCDQENSTAMFFVRKLPSEQIDGDFEGKMDTYWAGMLAGGMSYVFPQSVDCLEVQCVKEGNNSCRFFVGPTETLKEEHPELYEDKLGQHVT